jgi:major membrane immunogen (membrane-anchored lipoprotein)
MKLKTQLIVIIISSVLACNSKPSKEEANIFDGTYQITESGLVNGIGVWVFSKD